MRLGLNLGYWRTGYGVEYLDLATVADDLGFSSVWVSEVFSSDAVSVVSWIAARTRRVDVGTAVMQIPARAPVMTAMSAATVDALSSGRFRLGLGVSGPQVSEGWYGVGFDQPLARTREYVAVVRATLDHSPSVHAGPHYRLPLPDGAGVPFVLGVPSVRERVPVYLAAIGPRSLELAGEIADGWLGLFTSPEFVVRQVDRILAGRARVGGTLEGFDVAATTPLVVGDDVRACVDAVRPFAALYLGGMGNRRVNFYGRLAAEMGFGAEAARVQERFLAGRHDEAMALVPPEFVDATSLLGPPGRIAERMQAFAEAGVTTLNLAVMKTDQGVARCARAMRTAAEAFESAGLA